MIDELIKENQNLKEALKIALARNTQLEEQLKLNSKNSSKPPSSDHKKNTHNLPKNRGGGQKGHPPHLRKRFEEQEIQKTHLCSTNTCPRCGSTHITSTHATSYLDQVELENRKVSITRYHRPFYRCTVCKRSLCAPLPKGISHQYCLAHILRDFQRIADRNGDEGEIGLELVFHLREVFRLSKDSSLIGKEKRQRIHYRRRCIKRLLTEGLFYEENPHLVRFCQRLLDDYDRLWTFLSHPELENHNNRSERDLRPLVLWRKKSFGTQSLLGQGFVERIASVCGTLKKRKQSLLSFISKSFRASLFGEKFPSPVAN